MSPAELEAVQLRIIGAVNSDPINFGGIYLDEDGGLVILYVGANAGRAAVEEHVEPAVSVRWEKVDRSQAELMRILREISDRKLTGVHRIGIDTINNQVEVTVFPERHVDDVSDDLERRYSDAVNVVAGPPIFVNLPQPPSRSRVPGAAVVPR